MEFTNPLKGMKRWQIITVVAGAGGIGGYMVYRHHKTTGSWNPWSSGTNATSSASGSGINPITGLSYSDDNATDPITGVGYLAEAQQYGSVAAAESAVSAWGQSTATGSGIPVNPASPAPTGSLNTPVGSSVYTSNAAWSQAATAGLVSIGYDGPTVAAAIGGYLTQTPLDPSQIAIVNTAIAEYGPAPVGSLQVIPKPASGPGQNVPVVAPTVSSGHVVSVTKSSGTVAWTGNNAVKYTCTLTGPGPKNGSVQTVTSPTVTFTGLEPSHNYAVQILPYNSSGSAGLTGHIDFQTLAH